jgi:hypothetical protein
MTKTVTEDLQERYAKPDPAAPRVNRYGKPPADSVAEALSSNPDAFRKAQEARNAAEADALYFWRKGNDYEARGDHSSAEFWHQMARDSAPAGWQPPKPAATSQRSARRSNKERSEAEIVGGSSVYGPGGSGASWVQDVAHLRTMDYGVIPTFNRSEARGYSERLAEYALEVRANYMQRTPFGQQVRRVLAEAYRAQGYNAREIRNHVQDDITFLMAPELRAGSTGLASLGALVPPSFMLAEYSLYRTAAAPLVSAARNLPLPASGMKVDIPALTGSAGVVVQASAADENTSVLSASDTTATYREAPVDTFVSTHEVSQQALDRFGPGVTLDQVLARQAAREIGTKLDAQVAAAVIAAAQTITDAGTPSVGALFSDVAQAAVKTVTLEGTRLAATHVFMPSTNLLWFQSRQDDTHRPIWLPSGPVPQGGNSGPREGASGYSVMGAEVFGDDNLGATPLVLVGAPGDALLLLDAPPVINVWPSWDVGDGTQGAEALKALVTVRQYLAWDLVFPSGFVAVSGAAYPASPVW